MAIVFIESGGDATGGIEFYSFSVGTNVPTSSTTVAKTGSRSIRFQGNGKSYLTKLGVMADAGRRIQAHFRLTALPLNSYVPIIEVTKGNSEVYSVRLNSAGKVQLFASGVLVATGTTTIATGTWYKIALSFAITSATVNSAKVWLDAALEATGTNVTLGVTGCNNLNLGWITDPGLLSTDFMYMDNVYVDDSTAVTDPGEIMVTAKKPDGTGTNNFDTIIGGAPTNRWDHVDDVPLNIATGFSHNAATLVAESFALQAAAVGEVDLTSETILGRTAWIYAKRGPADGYFVQKCATEADETFNTSLIIRNGSQATVAGNTIVIAIAMNNDANNSGGIVSITDSAGNSYVLAAQKSGGGSPGSSVRTLLFYCQNALAVAAGNFNGYWTLNFPAVQAKVAMILEFSGISATPVDVISSNSDTTATPSSGTTSTPTQAAEIIIGAIGFEGSPFDWVSVGNGMTPDQQHVDVIGTSGANANISLEVQYTLQTVATAQTANGTLSGIRDMSALVVGFKSSGITVGDPKITDNGSDTSVVLNTTPTVHTLTTTSASYPSDIGMKSAQATADTFLYDCGTIIAFS